MMNRRFSSRVLVCVMKIYRRLIAGAITGLAALAISSCAYDPYYAGGSYSTGYGDGYGYGNSSFSTSVFVGTGSPRWGYDPYAGAYYDYTRRAYYDPYLYGYYPVGYRPRYVSGAPHPGGWSRGSSYCPPPSRVRSYNLTNYHNRTERYQGLGRDWSRNVQYNDGRNSYGSQRSSSYNRGSERDPRQGTPPQYNNQRREIDSREFGRQQQRGSQSPDRNRIQEGNRSSSRGNLSVSAQQQASQRSAAFRQQQASLQQRAKQQQAQAAGQQRARQQQQAALQQRASQQTNARQGGGGASQQQRNQRVSPPQGGNRGGAGARDNGNQRSGGSNPGRREESRGSGRSVRGLGQG